jgi:dTMP kinase
LSSTGKFIVIEGTDGSGKGTHTQLLVDWLKQQNKPVVKYEFPRHGQASAYFVDQYLSGAYGDLNEVSAQQGSLFYAMDRFEASLDIRKSRDGGSIIIADRYVGSNMAHQGGKIDSEIKRLEYYKWNDQLEYDILGIPRPDLNIVLRMPPAQAQAFVDQKTQRSYIATGNRDIHEDNLDHLERADKTYDEICKLFPDTFVQIECVAGGQVRPLKQIQADIQSLVHELII